jgi:beta-lactam-binding protein with PASTA domain
VLAATFLFGLVGVVYMSLQGSEVKVPEIVGRNFSDSEKELASLGLKIKRRAERPSPDAPNTVLEQLPKPGETVKTGQLILVVTSQPSAQTDETPSTLKKSIEEDDTEKIEEMISDKPKKKAANSNSNSNKKKADTTRDVASNSTADADEPAPTESNANKKDSVTDSKENKGKETTPPSGRQTPTPAVKPTPSVKPTPAKASGDRPRTVPRP